MTFSFRHATSTVALALTAVTTAAPLAHGADPAPAEVLALSTVQDTRSAMQGEAFAHASYLFFGDEARAEGHPAIARLFERTAEEELGDHFTAEAALIDFVGSDESNLRQAIEGERYESSTMYPTFAEEARQDGDTEAAELFTEIAADEDNHRKLLTQALHALTEGSGSVPAPPQVDPVTVPAGLPQVSSARTRANLDTAMHGEALANASYLLYADHAAKHGQDAIARLLAGLADVELHEHFAEEARLAGLVSDTADNLRTAIAGEHYEATVMYPAFAERARRAGDTEAADLFTEIAGDEADHAARFERALEHLDG